MPAVSPYATALLLERPAASWVPSPEDADRVRAYFTYEDIYHNVPEAFEVILRTDDGDDIGRRYVPSARSIIEATNRYLAKDMTFVSSVPPDVSLSEEDVELVMRRLRELFKREEFTAKFLSMKRWMLIKGDGLLHVSADPLKPEGSRIRITELSPEFYFPITDRLDAERVIGAYIVTIVKDDNDADIAQRIEYRRILDEETAAALGVPGAPLGSIFYRVSFWETDGWDDRRPMSEEDLKPVAPPSWAVPGGVDSGLNYLDGYTLPPSITAIPLYHFRNNRRGTALFGTSELQGVETLLAGVTQSITDTDIAAALQGIGVYYTDSSRPTDDDGNEQSWIIAPAAMIEIDKDAKLGRVAGVGRDGIGAMHDHADKLKAEARETTATPDVAVGTVDVQVAQSGVALSIQMAPVLSKNQEKEEEIAGKLDQLLYDLVNGWLPAYEGVGGNGVVVTVAFGDPLPVNREAVVKEVTELVGAKVISARYAAAILKEKLGYEIDPEEMVREIASEQVAMLDLAASRIEEEAADEIDGAGGGDA